MRLKQGQTDPDGKIRVQTWPGIARLIRLVDNVCDNLSGLMSGLDCLGWERILLGMGGLPRMLFGCHK